MATSGGLLGSRTWTQIISDALGKPITASTVGEAFQPRSRPARSGGHGEIEALESIGAPLARWSDLDLEDHRLGA